MTETINQPTDYTIPLSVRTRRRGDSDDRGSVQDCYACGLAYFSRWETDKPFSDTKETPSASDLECEKCVTERIFLRNMRTLSKNKKKK